MFLIVLLLNRIAHIGNYFELTINVLYIQCSSFKMLIYDAFNIAIVYICTCI